MWPHNVLDNWTVYLKLDQNGMESVKLRAVIKSKYCNQWRMYDDLKCDDSKWAHSMRKPRTYQLSNKWPGLSSLIVYAAVAADAVRMNVYPVNCFKQILIKCTTWFLVQLCVSNDIYTHTNQKIDSITRAQLMRFVEYCVLYEKLRSSLCRTLMNLN